MDSQKHESPEEALRQQEPSGQGENSGEESDKSTFLERYKRFPWWVKYGALIAIVGVFAMPQMATFEFLTFTFRTQDIVLVGLVSVLVSTLAYRFFEHKSDFIHSNAQWLFYAGLIFIVVPLIIAFFAPPVESLDPSINPQ